MRGRPVRPGRAWRWKGEHGLALPVVGCRVPGQGRMRVGPGRGQGRQGVHASALRVLVGNDGAHARSAPGVGGGQGGAEAGFVEEEEVQLPVPALF